MLEASIWASGQDTSTVIFVPHRILNCKQQKPALANSSRKCIHWEDIRWVHWVGRDPRGPSTENGQEPRQSRAQRAPSTSPQRRSSLRMPLWSRLSPFIPPHMITAHLQVFNCLLVLVPNCCFFVCVCDSSEMERPGVGLPTG